VRNRVGAWLLVGLLSAACGALAWSLGVILEGDVDDPAQYDYLWRPIDTLVEQRFLVMFVALVIVIASAFTYTRRRRDGHAPPDDVVAPVLLIGIVIGGGYSVVTAPVIGANIGGGAVLAFGPFVVLGLAALSIRAALRHRSTVRPSD
jgi:hypothetical protein